MQELWTMFIDNFYKFLVTGFFTFITITLRNTFKYYKKSVEMKQKALENDKAEQALLKQGMLSLLRFRIHRLCIHIAGQGYMTIDEKNDLVDLYESYKNLGGNSRTQIVYENIIDSFEVRNVSKTTPSDIFQGNIS